MLLLTNTQSQWLSIEAGHPLTVSAAQVHIYTILNWVLLGLVGLLGLLIVIRRWRRATPRTELGTTAAHRIDTPKPAQPNAATSLRPPSNVAELVASRSASDTPRRQGLRQPRPGCRTSATHQLDDWRTDT
jgi:hypothetical protein